MFEVLSEGFVREETDICSIYRHKYELKIAMKKEIEISKIRSYTFIQYRFLG